MAKIIGRGMTPKEEKFWSKMNEKENNMRLRWFFKNQQRLAEIAEQESLRKGLSPDVLEEVERMRQERYRTQERYGRTQVGEAVVIQDIDPYCILNIMKPIYPKTQELLYTNTEKRGTDTYLKARYKLKPEDRYYFTETTSFIYGWKIAERQKNRENSNYGRKQIINHSFYRRNGPLKREPAFQREPQKISPTVCGS